MGLAAFVLVSLVSALLAALVGVLDLRGSTDQLWGPHDFCGTIPLTGFQAFWDRFGWACLGALAVALGASAVLVPILLFRGRRLMAVALIGVTLMTAPIPWLIQLQRQDDTVSCFEY